MNEGSPYWYYSEILISLSSSIFANSLMTICNANENPATVSLIGMCAIFYNYLFDLAFFNVSYNFGQYFGILITCVFSLGSAIFRVHKSKHKQ